MKLVFNPTTGKFDWVNDNKDFVPYTGAVSAVDLGAHNLIVDTNSLFVDSVNHRVGIGTTTPSDKLTINGNIVPTTNSAFNLGNSSNYWANAYINNVYYNSSASINGTSHSGFLTFLNSVDNPGFYFQSPGGYYFRIYLYNNISGYEYVDFSRSSYFSKGFRFDSHLVPANSLLNNIGDSSSYWLNTYTQNLYLNSTAYLSGATAGAIGITGNVGIGTTTPNYKCHIVGTLGFNPGSSVTPVNNGDIVIEATNNTTLTFKLKGSDGVVRSGTLTLS